VHHWHRDGCLIGLVPVRRSFCHGFVFLHHGFCCLVGLVSVHICSFCTGFVSAPWILCFPAPWAVVFDLDLVDGFGLMLLFHGCHWIARLLG
jgi:hypothetical protein